MKKVLLAWLGNTDIKAARGVADAGQGPIGQALEAMGFDELMLLSNMPKDVALYVQWLSERTPTKIVVRDVNLASPVDHAEIYDEAFKACLAVQGKNPKAVQMTFHLSPGTPSMHAVWVLLGRTRFQAEMIQSSLGGGVHVAPVPFEISLDFLPDLLRDQNARLRETAEPSSFPEFDDVVHRSEVMSQVIHRARWVATRRDVAVIIEGESGTGKELFAKAIHQTSRREGEFVTVNCGAVAPDLIESELFGHERGAFTGAIKARKGCFETAHKGTLFLDELGELPLAAQVKLLRALQENEITRVGASKPIKVDVRVVAATNRTLTKEVNAGRFRADLFYRLAGAVLTLPPLRERTGDLTFLVDKFWATFNQPDKGIVSTPKTLTAGARKVLQAHAWPGNVRELYSTLRCIALWSQSPTVSAEEARNALLQVGGAPQSEILGRPIGNGFNLEEVLRDVAQHYLTRAIDEGHGNKTHAAELVGLPSYQRLDNWLKMYGVNSTLPKRSGVKAGRKSV